MIDLTVNARPALRLLTELAEVTKKDVPTIIRQQAGAMGRYLAENTQPVAGLSNLNQLQDLDGGSLKARDLGRNAAKRDVGRVYMPPGNAFKTIRDEVAAASSKDLAAAVYGLLKAGKVEEARALLRAAGANVHLDVMEWDNGELHRQRRDHRGRVPKSFRSFAVPSASVLRNYIKGVMDRVGWAKAAWVNAASRIKGALGLGKVRGWIKKHREAPASALDRTEGTNWPQVVLTSHVHYASDVLPARQYERAFGQFEQAIIKSLEIAIDKVRQRNPQS